MSGAPSQYTVASAGADYPRSGGPVSISKETVDASAPNTSWAAAGRSPARWRCPHAAAATTKARPRQAPPPPVVRPPPPQAEGDGKLTVGSLLPQTGNLAFLGPPEFAGVELAIKEINEAGGVLGKEVEYIEGDSGDTAAGRRQPDRRPPARGKVDAIIGAASSGVTLAVIDKITSARRRAVSRPANTSPDFTTTPTRACTSAPRPPTCCRAACSARPAHRGRRTNVGILALQDPYGEGLASNVEQHHHRQRRRASSRTDLLRPRPPRTSTPRSARSRRPTPTPSCSSASRSPPRSSRRWSPAGLGPRTSPVYLVDGNLGNALGDDLAGGHARRAQGHPARCRAAPTSAKVSRSTRS